MSINSEIRKIAKAWGVDTKGSSIKDALKDLRTNLPFGTKTEMVEIVPEQSVTGTEGSEQYNYHTENKIADFIINKTYTIAINGKQYKCTSVDVHGDGRFIAMGSIDGNVHSDIPFVIAIGLVGGSETEWFTDVVWNTKLGETITLAIYEEQVVYTPIAQEFIPNIAYFKDVNYDNYLTGVAMAEASSLKVKCTNMTFEQAVQHLMRGKPLMVVIQWLTDGPTTCLASVVQMTYDLEGNAVIYVIDSENNIFTWSAKGIATPN